MLLYCSPCFLSYRIILLCDTEKYASAWASTSTPGFFYSPSKRKTNLALIILPVPTNLPEIFKVNAFTLPSQTRPSISNYFFLFLIVATCSRIEIISAHPKSGYGNLMHAIIDAFENDQHAF